MYSKNTQNIVGAILIAVVAISSSIFAGGSILVYNNSFYNINFVVTTQSLAQGAINPNSYNYVQAAIVPAPTNSDGTLKMHATDANYVTGSNVPLGTISNVMFLDPAVDFDIQILDNSGNVISQMNLGTSLGSVVDTDPTRAVYIYSNVTKDTGVALPNAGGIVSFWDAAHALSKPSIQKFSPVTAA
jgi:hypothetical protein